MQAAAPPPQVACWPAHSIPAEFDSPYWGIELTLRRPFRIADSEQGRQRREAGRDVNTEPRSGVLIAVFHGT
jgi:hypothetical protein